MCSEGNLNMFWVLIQIEPLKFVFRATVTFDKEETIRGILTYAGEGGRVTKYHVQFWNSQTYQFEDIAVSLISSFLTSRH